MDRALADADWLRRRLDELNSGRPRRAKEWGRLAIELADLHVRWAPTSSKDAALDLEAQVLNVVAALALWNRQR